MTLMHGYRMAGRKMTNDMCTLMEQLMVVIHLHLVGYVTRGQSTTRFTQFTATYRSSKHFLRTIKWFCFSGRRLVFIFYNKNTI